MKKFNEDQKAKEKEEKRRAEEKKKEEKERGKKGGGGAPPPSTSSTPGSVFGVHGPNGCSEGEVSFVTHCLAWLEESGRGRLDERGVYRLSGSHSTIQKLKVAFNANPHANLDEYLEVHDVTGLLKLYLREMPEPLIPFNMYDSFITASQISDASRVPTLRQLVFLLPPNNRTILTRLMFHLNLVSKNSSKNSMDAKNLAIVFAPNLFRPKVDDPELVLADASYATELTLHMIVSPNGFFGVEHLHQPQQQVTAAQHQQYPQQQQQQQPSAPAQQNEYDQIASQFDPFVVANYSTYYESQGYDNATARQWALYYLYQQSQQQQQAPPQQQPQQQDYYQYQQQQTQSHGQGHDATNAYSNQYQQQQYQQQQQQHHQQNLYAAQTAANLVPTSTSTSRPGSKPATPRQSPLPSPRVSPRQMDSNLGSSNELGGTSPATVSGASSAATVGGALSAAIPSASSNPISPRTLPPRPTPGSPARPKAPTPIAPSSNPVSSNSDAVMSSESIPRLEISRTISGANAIAAASSNPSTSSASSSARGDRPLPPSPQRSPRNGSDAPLPQRSPRGLPPPPEPVAVTAPSSSRKPPPPVAARPTVGSNAPSTNPSSDSIGGVKSASNPSLRPQPSTPGSLSPHQPLANSARPPRPNAPPPVEIPNLAKVQEKMTQVQRNRGASISIMRHKISQGNDADYQAKMQEMLQKYRAGAENFNDIQSLGHEQ